MASTETRPYNLRNRLNINDEIKSSDVQSRLNKVDKNNDTVVDDDNDDDRNDSHHHSSEADSFPNINEKPVEDISFKFLYEPHTILLFIIFFSAVVYFAFKRDTSNVDDNYKAGIICGVFAFQVISVLTFPNGPFTRPHPAIWRMVFGASVMYLIALLIMLFQSYETVKKIFIWVDPSLPSFHIDMDKEYGVNCSDINVEKIWNHLDVFAAGHFIGWTFKAVLVRHYGLLWATSIMWELTEMAFAHLLPNFIECWWDALILDVLVCNALGIWVGLKICKILEMREYKWVSIRDIKSTTGKLKRAVLQFTPASWTSVRWLDPTCTHMRCVALCQLVIFWQVSELNTFFLKHVYEFPPSHPFVVGRLILVGLIVAPSVKQYYLYATDPACSRVGTQCWVYGAIMITEALLCIRHGAELFERTAWVNIAVWLLCQTIVSVLCVYGCAWWDKYCAAKSTTKKIS